MRFTAPAHTTGVDLSIGHICVTDGVIEVPDDVPATDLSGLAANGFTPAEASPKTAKPAVAVPDQSPGAETA